MTKFEGQEIRSYGDLSLCIHCKLVQDLHDQTTDECPNIKTLHRRKGFQLCEFYPYWNRFHPLPQWPGFKPLDIGQGVSAIACGAGLVSIPEVLWINVDGSIHKRWARYFLSTAQFGGLDGSGYVMIYGSNGAGTIARFALCEHKFVSTGGNPRRGWSPGYCSECNCNLSVDSSD